MRCRAKLADAHAGTCIALPQRCIKCNSSGGRGSDTPKKVVDTGRNIWQSECLEAVDSPASSFARQTASSAGGRGIAPRERASAPRSGAVAPATLRASGGDRREKEADRRRREAERGSGSATGG